MFHFLHCPLSGPVLIYISLLIIYCIIEYVTNKRTWNLEPYLLDDNARSLRQVCHKAERRWKHDRLTVSLEIFKECLVKFQRRFLHTVRDLRFYSPQ